MSTPDAPIWMQPLRWLLFSLGGLMIALADIAIAGLIIKEGLTAELMALAGVVLAVLSLTVGIIAFVVLIYARLRQVLSKDQE